MSSGQPKKDYLQYPIASGLAVNIAAGDIVNLVDNGTSTTITKQTGTGDTSTDIAMLGVFVGCTYTDPSTGQITFNNMWPTGTVASDALAYVPNTGDGADVRESAKEAMGAIAKLAGMKVVQVGKRIEIRANDE